MRGLIHHLDLSVTDFGRSSTFYATVLPLLGFGEARGDEQSQEWVLEASSVRQSVGITPSRGANATRPHDRYSPGLHHVAFTAEAREDVDRVHAELLRAGVTILDAPADYPQYNKGRGYYAVFFADPDGLKLEVVWTPPN